MADEVKRATFKAKDKSKLPTGAVVLNKDIRIEVEEIENGFIIEKTQDIKYSVNDQTDWKYIREKFYSKTNPLKIETEDKSLADLFSK